MLQAHEIYSIAASLYDAGWREDDLDAMIAEYDLTGIDAARIVDYFDYFAMKEEREENDYE